MTTKHLFITQYLVNTYLNKEEQEWRNEHLNLVWLREWTEGIVDVINYIADQTTEDEHGWYEELYDACTEAVEKYLSSQ